MPLFLVHMDNLVRMFQELRLDDDECDVSMEYGLRNVSDKLFSMDLDCGRSSFDRMMVSDSIDHHDDGLPFPFIKSLGNGQSTINRIEAENVAERDRKHCFLCPATFSTPEDLHRHVSLYQVRTGEHGNKFL
jgi:hypothetical protein